MNYHRGNTATLGSLYQGAIRTSRNRLQGYRPSAGFAELLSSWTGVYWAAGLSIGLFILLSLSLLLEITLPLPLLVSLGIVGLAIIGYCGQLLLKLSPPAARRHRSQPPLTLSKTAPHTLKRNVNSLQLHKLKQLGLDMESAVTLGRDRLSRVRQQAYIRGLPANGQLIEAITMLINLIENQNFRCRQYINRADNSPREQHLALVETLELTDYEQATLGHFQPLKIKEAASLLNALLLQLERSGPIAA